MMGGLWIPARVTAHDARVGAGVQAQPEPKSDQPKKDENSNKPQVQLTGKVVNRAGKRIAAADVIVQGATTAGRKTGPDGVYSFSVPAGKYTVRATKGGVPSDPITIDATKNSEVGDLTINIEK
jgi:hypothetical protein